VLTAEYCGSVSQVGAQYGGTLDVAGQVFGHTASYSPGFGCLLPPFPSRTFSLPAGTVEVRMSQQGTADSSLQYGASAHGLWRLKLNLPPPPVATYSLFGTGCAGSAGTPSLVALAGSLPRLGSAFTLQLAQMPAGSTALLFFGLDNVRFEGLSLPLELGFVGLPGCYFYTSADASVWVPTGAGSALFTVPICNCPSLSGLVFYNQAFVLDPGAPNAGGTTTNAGRGRIGI
jgi:hypothetical protein